MFLFCFIKNKTKNPQNAVILEFVSFKESQEKKIQKSPQKYYATQLFQYLFCIKLVYYSCDHVTPKIGVMMAENSALPSQK